jgi:succinylglutamate desuccinylase/aspartoacylase family protein
MKVALCAGVAITSEQTMKNDTFSTSFPLTPSALGQRPPRVIADVRGAHRGPTLAVVVGLHGDEVAGVLACERACAALAPLRSRLRGRVVFLAGNRQALGSGVHHVRRDINRGWTQPALERLRRLPEREIGDEDQEQLELAEALRALQATPGGPLIVVQLCTTSAPSTPFVYFGDTLRNRRLALSLPVTAVLGLEEVSDGGLIGYCTERGHVGIAFCAGRHADPESVERHVAALAVLLVAARCLPARAVAGLAVHRARLAIGSSGQPRVVEVLHRHASLPGDGFQMLPGFVNLTGVESDEVVASDARGPIRTPCAGLLLLPRYQAQGDDGFFLAREVRPAWLTISEWLRRAGVPSLLPHLPGIRRDPDRPRLLVVNPRVARAHVADVMHLCGYRQIADQARPIFSSRGPRRR